MRKDIRSNFFSRHPVDTGSTSVALDAFERREQVFSAQYRFKCDPRESRRGMCGVFHVHHGRCALLSSSSHSVGTKTHTGFLCFLRHATLCLRHRTPINFYKFGPLSGTAPLTMTVADYSRQALLRQCCCIEVRESSSGKNAFFPTMYLLHLHLGFRVASGFILFGRLTHLRMPYAVSVRQVSGLPPASFRSRLAADTLALGYVLGATPCTRDFHPLERAHAERTNRNAARER